MADKKQSSPSFATIISVLSILLYCAGFLRVVLELKDQKRRISALENVAETRPSTNEPNLAKHTQNLPGTSCSQHIKFSVYLTLIS